MKVLVSNNAKGTLSTGAVSHTLVLQDGEGSLFPSIGSGSGDFFYVRVGTDEVHFIARVIARTTDTLTTLDVVDEVPTGTLVQLTACAELFNQFQPYVSENKTLIVGGDVFDCATLAEAVALLANSPIQFNKTVTLSLRGLLNEVLSDVDFVSPERIEIQGATVAVTINSVQSSSGSAGDYSVILNLESVTGLAIHQVLSIYPGQLSGGTHPEYLVGAHKITNVDVGNTRITVNSKNPLVPSGAISGNATVLTTVLSQINLTRGGFKTLEHIAVDNQLAAEGYGLYCSGVSPVSASYDLALINAEVGLWVNSGVSTDFSGNISGCTLGIQSQGILSASPSISGCATALLQRGGQLMGNYLMLFGCANGLEVSESGRALLENSSLDQIAGVAVKASRYGYVKALTPTLTNTGTDYSPALNTQGNKFGYIDDGT